MSKNNEGSSQLGRDKEIEPEELLYRYVALKRFIEDNWGRIGLLLQRVRKPEDVRSALNRVPDAKWCRAFRDYPIGCLLLDGSVAVDWRTVRNTRNQHKGAERIGQEIGTDCQNAEQAAKSARAAYDAAVHELGPQAEAEESKLHLEELAKNLHLHDVETRAKELVAAYQRAQKERAGLAELLSSQEAWFARNEVVEFVRDPESRYSNTPENFAKAMAGLPFYDWLYSVRKCQSIPDVKKVPKTHWFQGFELLEGIVKRTKPARLEMIAAKLRNALLKQDRDLINTISPQWHYMTMAFNDCRGKKVRPADLPYRIMGRFVDHYEKHSLTDAELARYNQLV